MPLVGQQAAAKRAHERQQKESVKPGTVALPFQLPFVARGSKIIKVLGGAVEPTTQISYDLIVGTGNALQLIRCNSSSIAAEQQQQDPPSAASSHASSTALDIVSRAHMSFGAGACISAVDLLPDGSSAAPAVVVGLQDGRIAAVTVTEDGAASSQQQQQQMTRRRSRSSRGDEDEHDSESTASLVTSFVSTLPALTASSHTFSAARSGMTSLTALDASRVAVVQEWSRSLSVFDLSSSSSAVLQSIRSVDTGFPLGVAPTLLGKEQQQLAVVTGGFISLFDLRSASGITGTSSSMLLHGQLTCISAVAGRPHYLVSGGEDRSVTLWDLRKFTKQHVLQNVLKYTPSTVAVGGSNDSGIGVAVGGTDSEARVVYLPLAESGGSGGEKRKAGSGAVISSSTNVAGGTFRQRLSGSVHCGTSWSGAFDGIQDAAAGMSTEGEIFIAKTG